MKLGGIIVGRNQLAHVVPNIFYHLNHLKFDRIVYVDNHSYDGTADLLETFNEERLRVIRTGNIPFIQEDFTNKALDVLMQEYECDLVFPIDCDNLWVAIDEKWDLIDFRQTLETLGGKSFIANMYGYAPQQTVIDALSAMKTGRQHALGHWWQHLTYRSTYTYSKKLVMGKEIYAESDADAIFPNRVRFGMGNHPPQWQVNENWPEVSQIRVYEPSVSVDYHDYTRKSLNSVIGMISRLGTAFLDEKKNGVGFYVAGCLRAFMVSGEVDHIFSEMVFDDRNISAVTGDILGDGNLVCDTRLKTLSFDEPVIDYDERHKELLKTLRDSWQVSAPTTGGVKGD